MFFKPDFDRQQLERMKTNTREARRPQAKEDDSEADFKRPKFDSRNELSQRGGHRGRGGHRVADHVKNPEKYTKYSLKDVPEISNKSNSAAAFDFLQKLRKENNEEDEEPAADLSQKIVFKKRGKKESKSNAEQNEPNVTNVEKPESSGSGFQKESNTNSRSKNKNKSKLLTLSHLDEEEEEN